MFYLYSKNIFISNRYLWTQDEINEIDEWIKNYKELKLRPYELKKIFPVKKILKEKEKYYKDRLNRILEIERQLTIKVFETIDPIEKEKYRCVRDGLIPRLRWLHQLKLDQIKKTIYYYDHL